MDLNELIFSWPFVGLSGNRTKRHNTKPQPFVQILVREATDSNKRNISLIILVTPKYSLNRLQMFPVFSFLVMREKELARVGTKEIPL